MRKHLIKPLFVLLFSGLLLHCTPTKKAIAPPSITASTIEKLYQQGNYCEVLKQLPSYQEDLPENSTSWIAAELIKLESHLALEQWIASEKVLTTLKTQSISDTHRLSLLLLEARLLEKMNQLTAAKTMYDKVIRIAEETANREMVESAKAYAGIFYYNTGEYQQAEHMMSSLVSPNLYNPVVVAKSLVVLGHLQKMQSRNLEAEETFQIALTLLRANRLTQHPEYALLLNDYALTYLYNGQLEQTDSLLELSKKINSATCPIPSNTAYNLSTKANIQQQLGDYPASIRNFKKSLTIFQQIEQYKDKAEIEFKLGEIYFVADSLDLADQYFQESMRTMNHFIGEKDHLQKGMILQGLADLEVYNWNYEKADSCYDKSRAILANTIGKETINYGTVLTNLAISKEAQEELDTALTLFQQTAYLDTLLNGQYHPNYKATLFNLARCYSKLGNKAAARDYYKQAIQLQLQLLTDYFGGFSESARLKYRLEAMGNFDVFNTYACFAEDAALNPLIQDILLATKNRTLDYSMATQQLGQQYQDDNIQHLYQLWTQQKKVLTKSYLLSAEDREKLGVSIVDLQRQVEDTEKELTRLVPTTFKKETPNFQQLQKQLNRGEAAIDFFNFYVTDEYGQFPDSIFYVALITRSDLPTPQFVRLLESSDLEDLLNLSTHYTLNGEVNQYLYQQIWQPLEPYLEDISTIHLSPDGLLHQVAFNGLDSEVEGTNPLLNKYTIHTYSNLGDYLDRKREAIPIDKMTIVANPDYDAGMDSIDYQSSDYFAPISGTEQEAESIQQLPNLTNTQFVIVEEQAASEMALTTTLKQTPPSILHLATHGYFFQKKPLATPAINLGERILTAENGLLRSGIVLSGTNKHWRNKASIDPSNDGLWTALEIANLDLSNTSLVVLSACNTGRGDITDGEGVFGLQRAFKIAGVKYLLVSLWPVPDQQTASLMKYFYTALATNLTPFEALHAAQLKMQKEFPNPYDWAGFVLFE